MGFIRGICSSYTHILWSWLIFLLVDILDIGIKEIFGISTMIIGAVIGFILWIWITFFGDNGGHSDYEHEDMDHDMPIHVKIDN